MYRFNNDIDNIRLRKYSNRLYMSGLGMITFSIWSVVRYIVMIIQDKELVKSLVVEGDHTKEQLFWGYMVLLVFVLIVLVLIMMVPIYIGRCAMKIGRGKKKRKSVFYIIITILFLISMIIPYLEGDNSELSYGIILSIVAIIIDLTMAFACIEIIYCGIRLRKLDKRIQSGEGK